MTSLNDIELTPLTDVESLREGILLKKKAISRMAGQCSLGSFIAAILSLVFAPEWSLKLAGFAGCLVFCLIAMIVLYHKRPKATDWTNELSKDQVLSFYGLVRQYQKDPRVVAFAKAILDQDRDPVRGEYFQLSEYDTAAVRQDSIEQERRDKTSLRNKFRDELSQMIENSKTEGVSQ